MIIKFNSISVNTVESHSGLFIGYNYAPCWNSFSKTQELIGSVTGNNNDFSNSSGVIIDEDVIDMPVFSNCKR